MSIETLIERYGLQAHPEGGYFAETYRAEMQVETGRGPRAASTAIMFLLPAGNKSHLHRIASDEVWHFYEGGPLLIHELVEGEGESAGTVQITRLSPDNPQHIVPAGRWFGAIPAPGTGHALVGCTVAPGFDFADFELATPDGLLAEGGWSRQAVDVIKSLCAR